MRVKADAGKRLGAPRKPTADQTRRLLELYGITPDDLELVEISSGIASIMDRLAQIDELQEPPIRAAVWERDPGYSPGEDEDPLNAFITKCLVKGSGRGKLAGKKVGVKDSICLAGIPCTNGSQLFAKYIPDDDATVVKRVLTEGGDVVGKLNMACFSAEATSIDSDYGIVRNPWNIEYSAGGSSSGCGAAVASRDVDIALAADVGGSGRLPAAWCGCVCLKPTRGLVPSYGVVSFSPSMDAVSPTGRRVEDVAVTLEVIAGADGLSANQACYGLAACMSIPVEKYSDYLGRGVKGLRIGLLKESMDWECTEQDVVDAVKGAVDTFTTLGARCSDASFPALKYALAVHRAISLVENVLLFGGPDGYFRVGRYNRAWSMMFDNAFKAHPDQMPLTTKLKAAAGEYVRQEYYSRYYAKAQNLRLEMEEELSRLLGQYDVLVLPTVPFKALRYDELESQASAKRVWSTILNTAWVNLLGNPALALPCGVGAHNLPIGLQLVGRHFEESVLVRAGYEFELAIQ